jgi:GH35 family endo-1,4-beta-xylanase
VKSGGSITANGRVRFRRDLPGARAEWRYVFDHEGQPFAWTTHVTDSNVSFVLPAIRCGLSVLVERDTTKHPVWLDADSGGEHYGPDASREHSLAGELIRSKLSRLVGQAERYRHLGLRPHQAVEDQIGTALREGERAVEAASGRFEPRGARGALLGLVDACDALELAYARSRSVNERQAIGCDATMAIRARTDRPWHHLAALFGYVTVTFYTELVKTGNFEPTEGAYAFAIRDALVERATRCGLDVEGRPLLWLHPWVTPDWLASKDLDGLRTFLAHRIPAMVRHYEGRVRCWEVTNEAHDWADVLHLSHEEMMDVTRFASDLARRSSPDVRLLINTTDPFGTYAASGARADGSRVRGAQWTPYTYLRDLIRGGADFDISGVQIYRPYRDLTDTVGMLERIEALGKPVFITEIGVPSRDDELSSSSGDGETRLVYRWNREQQADWAEDMFTMLMSRPNISGIAWYDLIDRWSFLPGGGLLDRSWRPKPVYTRLEQLLAKTGSKSSRSDRRGPRTLAAALEKGARPGNETSSQQRRRRSES